jgi:hypothetical protein
MKNIQKHSKILKYQMPIPIPIPIPTANFQYAYAIWPIARCVFNA